MAAATTQPTPPITLSAAYAGRVDSGWVGYDYAANSIGAAPLTPTAQFTAIMSSATLPDGSTALSANAATDAGGFASLTLGKSVLKNNFTLVGVFQVRAVTGAGVGARSNTDNILLWRNAGNYNVRVNNVTTAGGAMPLDTTLNYVLSSTPSGIYLYVNGVSILTAAASASAADSGSAIEMFEDSRGGGGMNLDVAMCALLNAGVSASEANALSVNPWQIFEGAASGATDTPINPGAAAVTLTGYAPTVARTASQGIAPAAGAVLLTGYAPTVAQSASRTVAPASSQIVLTGFAPTITQTGQQVAPPPSGGGGPVREVRAFARSLDQPEKRSRSEKRARRRQLETEALELLPDLPEAEAFAPIVARLVFEQEARALANWTPVRAMVPLAFNAERALREQIAAWQQQIEQQKLIDDEHDLELLLLG